MHGADPKEPVEQRLHARIDGYDLHVSPALEAEDRVAVERFCRYALRGPIANGRLQRGPRDLLTYQLKTPKPDGTTAVVLGPMALLQRLARLIPLPGRHMVRYHGVLSSAAEWRSRVVPNPPVKLDLPLRRSGARRIDWGERSERAASGCPGDNLLRRVYLLEVLACAVVHPEALEGEVPAG